MGHLLMVRGGMNFGQVTMTSVMAELMKRVFKFGVVTAFVRSCNHIGEAGQYLIEPASRGFAGKIELNVIGVQRVAPFGACQPRMGTNVMAWGFPRRDSPLIADASACEIVIEPEGQRQGATQSSALPALFSKEPKLTSDHSLKF